MVELKGVAAGVRMRKFVWKKQSAAKTHRQVRTQTTAAGESEAEVW